jgi:hypothetical protein
MKKILFFLVLLIRFNSANSQVKNSENGYIVTQKGTMRLLIVYAEIDYTGSGITDPFAINSSWQAGQLPANAGIEFDADLPMGGPTMGTITDYYYQASCGNYILLGDYYNNVVTLPYNVNSNGSADVISYLNNHNFRTGHNKTLADFDN